MWYGDGRCQGKHRHPPPLKHNYRHLNGWIHPELIIPFLCTPILYPVLMISFYHICLQLMWPIYIRNLSQFYNDIVAFKYDLYSLMYIYYIHFHFTNLPCFLELLSSMVIALRTLNILVVNFLITCNPCQFLMYSETCQPHRACVPIFLWSSGIVLPEKYIGNRLV